MSLETINAVNDGTREKLKEFANDTFYGLKAWTWETTQGPDLPNAKNFAVTWVFPRMYAPEVARIVAQYENGGAEPMADRIMACVLALSNLSAYDCAWA